MIGPLGARDPPPACGRALHDAIYGVGIRAVGVPPLFQAHDHLLQPAGPHPPIHQWAPAQVRHHRGLDRGGMRLRANQSNDSHRRAGGRLGQSACRRPPRAGPSVEPTQDRAIRPEERRAGADDVPPIRRPSIRHRQGPRQCRSCRLPRRTQEVDQEGPRPRNRRWMPGSMP